MDTEPDNVRRTILRQLREQLKVDVILVNSLLDVMIGNNMRNSSNLVTGRNELLRTIVEKKELIRVYRAM
nr:hypothetical protein [Tanacetum cinerariifolium]